MNQDLEKVYDEMISPLMTQIIAICKERGMPMLASFQYAPEELCTSALLVDALEPSASLIDAYRAIRPGAGPRFTLRTMDADGRVVREEVILP